MRRVRRAIHPESKGANGRAKIISIQLPQANAVFAVRRVGNQAVRPSVAQTSTATTKHKTRRGKTMKTTTIAAAAAAPLAVAALTIATAATGWADPPRPLPLRSPPPPLRPLPPPLRPSPQLPRATRLAICRPAPRTQALALRRGACRLVLPRRAAPQQRSVPRSPTAAPGPAATLLDGHKLLVAEELVEDPQPVIPPPSA
jgi:hypothetical protein